MVPWKVLVIDDEEHWLEVTVELLSDAELAGAPLLVLRESDFSRGLERLADEHIDAVVLDVRDENPSESPIGVVDNFSGRTTFESIRERQFVPVVFQTGYPSRVEDLEQLPLVQIVCKGGDPGALEAALSTIFGSKLPQISRGLTDHVREVLRDYLWDYAGEHWDQISVAGDGDLAHQLTSRLAVSLSRKALPYEGHDHFARGWHPSQFYLVPPLTEELETGSVLFSPVDESWRVVLTPSCDLAQGKADFVLTARANLLTDVEPFDELLRMRRSMSEDQIASIPRKGRTPEQSQHLSQLNNMAGKCRDILRGKISRYFHLPRFLEVPDLLLDLQGTETYRKSDAAEMTLVATLNPPYTQALTNRFTTYVGRVGLADPDVDAILGYLH